MGTIAHIYKLDCNATRFEDLQVIAKIGRKQILRDEKGNSYIKFYDGSRLVYNYENNVLEALA